MDDSKNMKLQEFHQNKYYINFMSATLAFITLLVLTLNMEIVGDDIVETLTTSQIAFINTLVKLEYSLNGYNILWLIFLPILYKYYKNVFFLNKKNRSIRVPAVLFSFFMLFGKSFELAGSWKLIYADPAQVIKSFISGIGYYALFYCAIYYIFEALENRKHIAGYANSSGIMRSIFEKRSFLISFLIIIIVWTPYFIAHSPGMFMYDTGMQILQYFNIEDSTAKYLNLLSEDVKLNNHHPVLHTLFLGGCVKIGQLLFQSDNIGYYIYALIQMLISAGTIAYSIHYMTKKQVPYWFRTGTLIFYCIVPAFANWAILGTKDTLFACIILLYVIDLVEMIENPETVFKNRKKIIRLFFLLIACSLLRNNGIYVILLSFPFLVLLHKKYIKHVILVGTGVFILYYGFNNLLLPNLQITGGSVREALSIPFQQTARYVRDYGYDVTEEEKRAINAILQYDLLAVKYNPDLSDPVKKLFNEDADSEDLSCYFRVWFLMFLKHPDVYVQATMNNVYGYFYFSKEATPIYNWIWAEECMDRVNISAGFEFGFIDSLEPMRNFFYEYSKIFKKIPGLSLLHSSAIYSWILILGIAFAVRIKDGKYLIGYAPLIALLIFCIISPSNGNRYFRYSYPIAYCLPVVLGIQLSRLRRLEYAEGICDKNMID